MTSFIDGP